MTARVVRGGPGLTAQPVAALRRLRRWLPALRYCFGVYLAVRVALFALGWAIWSVTGDLILPAGHSKPVADWAYGFWGWIRLDAGWFLKIAQVGYSIDAHNAPFYPGYPILERAASYLTLGNFIVAGFLVSNLALLGALLVLYRLTELEFDTGTARRAVLYLCLFPTAFFLFDAYSESLFLLGTVGAVALARQGQWGWAALAGLGAGLTRSTGVILVLVLAVEALHQAVEERRSGSPLSARRQNARTLGRLALSAVPVLGSVAYLAYWQLRFHDWYEPIRLEKTYWNRDFSLPWVTLWHGFTAAWQHGLVSRQGWWTLDLALVVTGLLLGGWVASRTRPVYAVYTWASIVFFLCSTLQIRPLVSDPRYLVTIFPLIWPLAVIGRQQHLHEAVLVGSAASLTFMSVLFLTTQQIF